tara:strand:- start:1379 stop:1576 length:198 start_codon:yes stop_codon:yes gene_type:complete
MIRKEGESYRDYKKRRDADAESKKKEQESTKSRFWPGDWGSYQKDIHGRIETRIKKMLEKFKNKE